MQNISYDLVHKCGSTFMLQDCLQSGLIGLMTIAQHRHECLKEMSDALRFIETICSGSIKSTLTMPHDMKTDNLEFKDVVSAVRMVQKTQVKKIEKQKLVRDFKIKL